MNSNRPILRPTHNRLPLTVVSTQKSSSILVPSTNKTKYCVDSTLSYQQENVVPVPIKASSRPVLTATRSIKQQQQQLEDDSRMHVSPMVTTVGTANIILVPKQSVSEKEDKSYEQLELELFELPDYRQSIFEHLKAVEPIYAPKMNFMEHQSDINSTMRSILIDWLIEVADEYKLNDETLFLCIQYVDRFLSTVNVTRSKLQLLGTTCMYLASKYEEMYPPALDEFSFITDNTYETKHILRMEQIVMKMLNFSLSGPTPYTFLQHYLTVLKSSSTDDPDEHKSLSMLSKYLCTLALVQDRPFSSYRSSMMAASCLLLANRLLNKSIWTNRHVQITTYTQRDLNECTLILAQLHSKTFTQDQITSSVLRRYLNKKDDGEPFQRRIHELIHAPKSDDDDGEILDLTLDDIDEDDEDMSMDNHR